MVHDAWRPEGRAGLVLKAQRTARHLSRPVAHFKWPITRTSSRDVSRRPGPLSSNRAEDCDGQAFFQRIDIDEDNDIRVGYATPFDALCDPELQADALTWAAHAKTPIGSTTSSEDGPEATSLNLTRLG